MPSTDPTLSDFTRRTVERMEKLQRPDPAPEPSPTPLAIPEFKCWQRPPDPTPAEVHEKLIEDLMEIVSKSAPKDFEGTLQHAGRWLALGKITPADHELLCSGALLAVEQESARVEQRRIEQDRKEQEFDAAYLKICVASERLGELADNDIVGRSKLLGEIRELEEQFLRLPNPNNPEDKGI